MAKADQTYEVLQEDGRLLNSGTWHIDESGEDCFVQTKPVPKKPYALCGMLGQGHVVGDRWEGGGETKIKYELIAGLYTPPPSMCDELQIMLKAARSDWKSIPEGHPDQSAFPGARKAGFNKTGFYVLWEHAAADFDRMVGEFQTCLPNGSLEVGNDGVTRFQESIDRVTYALGPTDDGDLFLLIFVRAPQ
jgi:hypothetical protein